MNFKYYPNPPSPKSFKYEPELVERGFQDHPCLNDKITALGKNDYHKKGSWHPVHNSGACHARNHGKKCKFGSFNLGC